MILPVLKGSSGVVSANAPGRVMMRLQIQYVALMLLIWRGIAEMPKNRLLDQSQLFLPHTEA